MAFQGRRGHILHSTALESHRTEPFAIQLQCHQFCSFLCELPIHAVFEASGGKDTVAPP